MDKYDIMRNQFYQKAIFETETGRQISQWWDDIEFLYGLLRKQSDYYIAKNQYGKWAIFHKDNPDEPISQWLDRIERYGLILGMSEYYIATQWYQGTTIFHKDTPDEPISKWWLAIDETGLVNGESEYYIARNQDYRLAIFYKDNPNVPVSQWWRLIYPYGLVNEQSEYYIVQNYDSKSTIFHKDYPYDPIGNWHYYIYPFGLINNTSELYAAIPTRDNHSPIQIYYYNDMQQPLYEMRKVNKNLLFYFTDTFALYLTKQYIMRYDAITEKRDIVGILPKDIDIQRMLYKAYNNKSWDNTSNIITNQLISQYINYNFIPLVFQDTTSTLCYLFNTNGDYIGKFNDVKDLKQYMQQGIVQNENVLSDEIRLY